MDGFNGHTAEIEDMSICETLRVGPWCEIEPIDNDLLELSANLFLKTIDFHEPIQALHTSEIGMMDVNPRVLEKAITGHVVLVGMAIDDGIDRDRDSAS
jgi:hypothetical protein